VAEAVAGRLAARVWRGYKLGTSLDDGTNELKRAIWPLGLASSLRPAGAQLCPAVGGCSFGRLSALFRSPFWPFWAPKEAPSSSLFGALRLARVAPLRCRADCLWPQPVCSSPGPRRNERPATNDDCSNSFHLHEHTARWQAGSVARSLAGWLASLPAQPNIAQHSPAQPRGSLRGPKQFASPDDKCRPRHVGRRPMNAASGKLRRASERAASSAQLSSPQLVQRPLKPQAPIRPSIRCRGTERGTSTSLSTGTSGHRLAFRLAHGRDWRTPTHTISKWAK